VSLDNLSRKNGAISASLDQYYFPFYRNATPHCCIKRVMDLAYIGLRKRLAGPQQPLRASSQISTARSPSLTTSDSDAFVARRSKVKLFKCHSTPGRLLCIRDVLYECCRYSWLWETPVNKMNFPTTNTFFSCIMSTHIPQRQCRL
jgi:hypothetical protein